MSGGGVTERVVWRLVPRRSAVRRLIVHGTGGRGLEEQTVALAPEVLGAHDSGEFASSTPPPPGEAFVAAGPAQDGEGALRVRGSARACARTWTGPRTSRTAA